MNVAVVTLWRADGRTLPETTCSPVLQLAISKRGQRVHVENGNGMTPDRFDNTVTSELGDGP